MNMRVKNDEVSAATGQQTINCVLAALGLQAVMPAAPQPAGERWVASWRFCEN